MLVINLDKQFYMQPLSTELILIRVTGEDRPGLTASVTEILAKYDATILDMVRRTFIIHCHWVSYARQRNNIQDSS